MDWTKCSQVVYKTDPETGDKITSEVVGIVPSFDCVPMLFAEAVYWAFVLAGSIAVVIIIWAGIKYIRSGGDQKQVQSARSTLTFGIIGLIVILASVFIINIVAYVSGADCIKRFGFRSCEVTTTGGGGGATKQ